MVVFPVFAPLLLLGVMVHVSVITAYHYVQSPLLGAVAFVFSILELYFLLFGKKKR